MFEERQEDQRATKEGAAQETAIHDRAPKRRWLAVPIIALLFATLFTFATLLRERRQARELAADNAQFKATLSQTRSQMDDLTSRLYSMSTQLQAQQAAAEAAQKKVHHRRSSPPANKPRPAEDRRWEQIQAELAEHKKRIDDAKEDIAKTRSDLEGNLKSTKDELGGDIARNHDELVALEKRGERNYFEFSLVKAKQFRRVGSISLSLRKANTKRDQYDMVILVDDNPITKKRVSLYEPVLLYAVDSDMPVEVVVNQIEQNQVRGYVSEPKYKKAELTANAPAGSETSSSSDSPVSLSRRPEASR